MKDTFRHSRKMTSFILITCFCSISTERVILICLVAPYRVHENPEESRDPAVPWPQGSCGPAEVNSAVIPKTATRRCKQTAQNKQHPINTNTAPLTGSHQQGGSESAEQSWQVAEALPVPTRRCSTAWKPRLLTQSLLFFLKTCNSHLHGPRMPYGFKDPGNVMSLNLRAAPCPLPQGEKMETGWRFWQS